MGKHVAAIHAGFGHPEIVIIAALAREDRLIGRGLALPWPPLREDLRRFKRLTSGHALIVGRTTFESIVHQFGRPLPKRRMMVLTSRGVLPGYPDVETFASLPAALHATRNARVVFIGGGAQLYAEALPLADRLELTLVEGRYKGDKYFPPYAHLIGPRYVLTDEKYSDGCAFVTYRRHEHAAAWRP